MIPDNKDLSVIHEQFGFIENMRKGTGHMTDELMVEEGRVGGVGGPC